jgi:amino acid adenylation domain-containing protein
LDTRSDQLSAALQENGVRPGDQVGVFLGRSTALIAVLLGVVKAGASYVPLDPAAPGARSSMIVEDCEPVLVVSDESLPGAGELPGKCLHIENLLSHVTQEPQAAPQAGPDDRAYVIYTSGSTGRPKGVVIPHRNVVNLIAATADDFGFGPQDVWTWFHSVAFDFSVWEIWGCLLTGGRLVLVPENVRHSPEEFCALMAAQRVTVLNQTPSSFAHVLEAASRRPTRLPLRLVIFGGEPLDTVSLLRWFDIHPEPACGMVNMFGITETTVHVTAQKITRELAAIGSKSVGHPIPGWSVRVVDDRRRLLPIGGVGEIVVGGTGVATGYLNRDDLTAARFGADPRDGERLYFSGDRGRLLPDGRLEHLGRLDQQIKLRGHRIELGEIRAALLADTSVHAAAVLLRHTIPGDPAGDRLDGYVVLADGANQEELPAIRSRCAERLPSYMVPSTLTAVEMLPLTVNGKLDTSALPVPRLGRVDDIGEPTPDVLTTHQRTVLDAWSAVLGVQVGLDDRFFDVGGNSLLAVRVVQRLREAGLSHASVRELYTHPTPRGLAARLSPS